MISATGAAAVLDGEQPGLEYDGPKLDASGKTSQERGTFFGTYRNAADHLKKHYPTGTDPVFGGVPTKTLEQWLATPKTTGMSRGKHGLVQRYNGAGRRQSALAARWSMSSMKAEFDKAKVDMDARHAHFVAGAKAGCVKNDDYTFDRTMGFEDEVERRNIRYARQKEREHYLNPGGIDGGLGKTAAERRWHGGNANPLPWVGSPSTAYAGMSFSSPANEHIEVQQRIPDLADSLAAKLRAAQDSKKDLMFDDIKELSAIDNGKRPRRYLKPEQRELIVSEEIGRRPAGGHLHHRLPADAHVQKLAATSVHNMAADAPGIKLAASGDYSGLARKPPDTADSGAVVEGSDEA